MTDFMCQRCAADPQPENFGNPRRCAFNAEGSFTQENWNCATLDALLDIIPTSLEHEGSDREVAEFMVEQWRTWAQRKW